MADYKGLNVRYHADSTEATKALHLIAQEAKLAQGNLTGVQNALKSAEVNGRELNDALKSNQVENLARAMDAARDKAQAYKDVLPQLKDKLADVRSEIAETKAALDGTGEVKLFKDDGSVMSVRELTAHLNALEEQECKLASEVERTNTNILTSESAAKTAAAAYETYASKLAAGRTELGQFGEDAEKYGKNLESMGDMISSIGDKMTIVSGVALMTFGRSTVQATEEFGNAMAQMGGYLDISGAQLEHMSDLALKWGKETQFSATEAAQAMGELAKGGMTQAQIEGGAMEATMNLAAAGELNMASAAEVAVQAIKTFRLEASDANKVADALAGAANTSTAEVSDLAQGFTQVGGAANMANWNVNEVTGALALLADRGFSGAEAGTVLKTMLQRLASPTKKAKETMDELGISVYDSSGRMVPAIDVIKQFEGALDELTDEQKNKALLDIFGMRGVNGMSAMLNSTSEKFQEYIDATNQAGYATEMAKSRMGELGWALEYLRGEAETATVNFGQALAPTITNVAKAIESGLQVWNDMSKSEQEHIANMALMVTAAGPVLSIVGHLTSGIGGFVSTIGQGATAFSLWRENGHNVADALANTLVPAMSDTAKHAELVAEKTAVIQQGMTNLATGAAITGVIYLIGSITSQFMDYIAHEQEFEQATQGLHSAIENIGQAGYNATGGFESMERSLNDIRDASRNLNESQAEIAQSLQQVSSGTDENTMKLNQYMGTIGDLAGKSSLTVGEQERLKKAVEGVNGVLGTSVSVIDAQNGQLSTNYDTLLKVADAYRKYAEVQATMDAYAKVQQQIIENAIEMDRLQNELSKADKGVGWYIGDFAVFSDFGGVADKYHELEKSMQQAKDRSDELAFAQTELEKKMDGASTSSDQYNKMLEDMNLKSKGAGQGITDAGNSLDEFADSADNAAEAAKQAADEIVKAAKRANEEAYRDQQREYDREYKAQQQEFDAEYKVQQREYDREYKERQRAYDAEYKEQQRQFDREYKDLSNFLDKQYDAKKSEYDKEYKLLKSELDKQYSEQKKQQDKAYSQLKSQLDKQYQAQRDANSKSVSNLKSSNSQAEKALKSSLDNQYKIRKSEIDKEFKQLQKANDNILKKAKETYKAETDAFKAETKRRIAEIKAEYEAKKKALEGNDGSAGIDAQIKAMQDQTKAEQAEVKKRAEQEKKAELEKAVASAKTRRTRQDAEKALNEYLAELAQEAREEDRERQIEQLEEQKELIKERTEIAKEALDEERDQRIAEYEARRDEELSALEERQGLLYEKLQEQLDAQEELQKQKNDAILEQYRASLDLRLEAMQAAHDEEEQRLSDSLAAQLEKTKAANEERLAALKENQAAELEQTKLANEEILASKKEANDAALASLKESNELQLSEMKDSQSIQLENLKQGQSEQLEALKQSQSDQLDVLKQSQSDQLQELKYWQSDQLQAMKNAQDDAIDQLKKSLADGTYNINKAGGDMANAAKNAADQTVNNMRNALAPMPQNTGETAKLTLRQYLDNINDMPWSTKNIADTTGHNLQERLNAYVMPTTDASKALRNAALREIEGLPEDARQKGESTGSEFSDGLGGKESEVSDSANKIKNAVENPLSDIMEKSGGFGAKTGNDYGIGIEQGGELARTSAQNVGNDVSDALQRPSDDSSTWGYDMMRNLNDAIVDFWNNTLVRNVENIAQGIANILGHSKPKEGPLKNDDQWFYHLGKNLNDGLERSIPALMATVYGLASDVESGMNVSPDLDIAGKMIENMRDEETALARQSRRMAGIVENEFAPSIGFAANSSYDVKPMVNGIVGGVREALRSGMPHRQGVTVIVNGLSVRETADVDRISERLCQKVVQAERRGLV